MIPDIEPIKRHPAQVQTREEFEREFQAKFAHLNVAEFVAYLADEDDAMREQGGCS